MAAEYVSSARLRELLDYDPQTGLFTRRVWRGGTSRPGSVAGGSHGKTGYRQISVDGRLYFAHRLAWFYVHGVWPNGQIDHINGTRSDNRIDNLRDVQSRINTENQRRPRRDNSLGLLGVHKFRKSFIAQLQAKGRMIYLGSFKTAEEASAAYLAAKRALHEGCTL